MNLPCLPFGLRSIYRGLIICTLFFPLTTFGQGLSSLTPISQQEAINDGAAREQAFGFTQVYFDKTDLNNLIAQDGVEGVRLYTGKKSGFLGMGGGPVVIAVGVRNDGTELGNYLRSGGLSTDIINAEQAAEDVERSKNSDYSTIANTVDAGELQNAVMQENSSGIHVRPGSTSTGDTFIYVAASSDGAMSMDQGETYYRDDQPCPPDCGTGLLVELN